ncbi:MAG: outer membrane lipoprotein carrier protein LolA [Flavobacterium sp.]|nr:outer membrane lipoprotein carrier protein LolA [Flavobacterium sp.]
MNKIVMLSFACLLLAGSLFAQNDPAAKKVLDGVSANIKNFKAITSSITIKSLNSKGVSNGSKSGTISYKNKKYLLKQGKTEVICDGNKVYNFDGNNTITVTGADEAESLLSPQKLFSNFYDKDFTYKLVSSAGTTYQIELTPTDKRKNFSKVLLFIDKTKNMFTKVNILDKGNNKTEISLTNLNTNASLNDAIFIFNKSKYPAKVEILD